MYIDFGTPIEIKPKLTDKKVRSLKTKKTIQIGGIFQDIINFYF